jgi:hypothetical protein
MAFITSLLTTFGPIILWVMKLFIRNQARQEEMIKSFYAFLDAADASVKQKVNSQLSLKAARRKKQMQLLADKKKRENDKKITKGD